MAVASARPPARQGGFLRFLDYFCALFALVLINAGIYGIQIAGLGALAVVTGCFVASWFLWRRWPGNLSALLVAVLGIAVLVFANNPISVVALWLSIVALALTFSMRVARLYCAIPIIAVIAQHLSFGSPLSKIAIEAGAMLVAMVAGVTLAGSIARAVEDNQRLRIALRDSRELALAQERERFSALLHNGLGHQLTSIGMSLDYSARMIDRDADKARGEIQGARIAVSEALKAMRQTVRAIKPATLDHEGLEQALRNFTASFRNTGLVVQVRGGWQKQVNDEFSRMILHFVQEALTNAVRHSSADLVVIELSETSVAVSDNGSGNSQPAGFGLASLRNRAAELGAEVAGSPHGGIDGGFRLSLTLPTKDSE